VRELSRPSQRMPGRPRPPRPPPKRPRSRASPPRPRLSFPQTGAEDSGSPSALVPSPCGHSQRPMLNRYPEMSPYLMPLSVGRVAGRRRCSVWRRQIFRRGQIGGGSPVAPEAATGTVICGHVLPGLRHARLKISGFRLHEGSGLAGAALQFAGADERVSWNGSVQVGGPFSGKMWTHLSGRCSTRPSGCL
jgi:hypothetical protein